jgi:hypothetical protein
MGPKVEQKSGGQLSFHTSSGIYEIADSKPLPFLDFQYLEG